MTDLNYQLLDKELDRVKTKVFLGSNARKIVHNAPVPCLILPRGEE